SQTKDRQMTQTNRLSVRVQFVCLFAAMRTSGALKRAFDRHSQVAAIKAGMKHSDVRQIQWDFNQSWHRQFLLKPCCCFTANLDIAETSRASHAKQSIGTHKMLWTPRELRESHIPFIILYNKIAPEPICLFQAALFGWSLY